MKTPISLVGSSARHRAAMAAAVCFAFALLTAVPAPAQEKAAPPAVDQAPPPAAKKTPPPTLDQMVQYFESIVFESEYGKLAPPSKVIKKWTGPLRIAIRAFEEESAEDKQSERKLVQVKVKQPYLTFIQRHLNTLARETGLVTEDAKKTGEPPNFMINFVPRKHMADPILVNADPAVLKRMAAEGGCYFVAWSDDRTGSIFRVAIVVNSERLLIRINHCLLEEMTQSLGLPNDTNMISPSIFHDDSRQTELSRTDLSILRTLYDPRIKAGMPKAEAMAKVREVIAELMAKYPPE